MTLHTDNAKVLEALSRIEAKLDRLHARLAENEKPRREWYSTREAAEILGYKSSRSVLRLIEHGELGCCQGTNGWMIPEASLREYLNQIKQACTHG